MLRSNAPYSLLTHDREQCASFEILDMVDRPKIIDHQERSPIQHHVVLTDSIDSSLISGNLAVMANSPPKSLTA